MQSYKYDVQVPVSERALQLEMAKSGQNIERPCVCHRERVEGIQQQEHLAPRASQLQVSFRTRVRSQFPYKRTWESDAHARRVSGREAELDDHLVQLTIHLKKHCY